MTRGQWREKNRRFTLRILWDNFWDLYSLTESQEDSSYPVENTQDIRLVKSWRTTTASAATVTIASGSAAKAIFRATTNLFENSNALTLWTTSGSIVTSSGLFYDGSEFWKVTNAGTAAGIIYQEETGTFTTLTPSGNMICRKGNSVGNTAYFSIYNLTSAVTICALTIDFDNYPVSPGTAISGTLRWYEWIDSKTVELHYTCSALSFLTDDVQIKLFGSPNATAGEYTYWMRPQLENLFFDTPYVNGSRSAVNLNYAFEMPVKFIFKIKMRPWFDYITGKYHRFLDWYVDTDSRFRILYDYITDKIITSWQDNGSARTLSTEQFYSNINSKIILFGAIDLTTQTGNNRFFAIVAGTKQAESTNWGGVPDAKKTPFPTLSIGQEESANHADSQFESVQFWAWDGSALGTLANEAAIDAAMAGKPRIFEQIYLPKIKADCAAIVGHNLSPDATIGIRGNDYDSWNGLTAETMTWRADTIVKFMSSASYPFWRFSIIDPNVSDGYFEIGRFMLGEYLQVDPSSLVEFPEEHVRPDRQAFSRSNQFYADEGVGYKQLSYKFEWASNSAKTLIEAMWDGVGMKKPLLFLNYDQTFTVVPPLYCVITESITFDHKQFDRWNFNLNLREVD